MKYVKSFKELEVYKFSRELAKEIFFLTKDFPSEEKYSLTDQVRRSSRSIGAQIAESYLLFKCESIGKMLNSMMDKSSLFCKKDI